MKIILFSGWRRSGKSVASDYLERTYGVRQLSFAKVLKDMTAEQYQIPREWCDDPKLKEVPIFKYPVNTADPFSQMIIERLKPELSLSEGRLYWNTRALLILEGGVKRSVNSNYWTNKVINLIKECKDPNAVFVISDLRFRSEVEAFKREFKEQVITARVERFEEAPSRDSSEIDLDGYNFDIYLPNKSTFECYYSEIDRKLGVIIDEN